MTVPLTRLRFELAGEVHYSRGLLLAAEEARDLSEPLEQAGHLILGAVAQQFATEGRRAGGWPPLSPRYAAWKAAHYPGRPILVLTGQMKRAALDTRALQVTPRRLTYQIDDPKALYHQVGAGRLPVRRVVDLTGHDRRMIDRAFARWLARIRARAG